MRKILNICLCLLLVAALTTTAFAAGGASFSFAPSSSTVAPGGTITVTASVSNDTPATSYGLMLSYDSSVFEITGTAGATGALVNSFNNGFANMFQTATAYSGTVGTMTVKVKESATPGTYVIKGEASVKNGSATVEAYGCSVTITVPCSHPSWTDATCTSPKTCSACGATEGSALGHNYGAWTNNGENHKQTCSRCGDVKTEAHKGGTATCVAKAKCSECKVEYGSVNAKNHTGGTKVVGTITPSCNTAGYTGDTICVSCENVITAGKVDPATGNHVDADNKWNTNGTKHWHECSCGTKFDENDHTGGTATCKEAAKCSTCGVSYGNKNATNHVGGTEIRDAVKESCKDDGYTGDTYCKGCGVKTATGTTIPATGKHVDADGKWESDGTNHWHTCGCGTKFDQKAHTWVNATCTAAKYCSVCNKTEGSALDHDWVDATCTAPKTCDRCKTTQGQALGHSYGAWTKLNADQHKRTCTRCNEASETKPHSYTSTITLQPTCGKDGVRTYTCNVCNDSYTEVIKATGEHVYTNWTKVDNDTHKGTCGCGATSTVAHKWGAAVTTKPATCGEDGEKTFTCNDCKATKTEVIKATGEHVYTNWEKVDNNNHKGTCGCGATKTEAHKWDKGTVTTEATCSTDGVKTFTCSTCKGTKTETIKATGDHVYTGWIEIEGGKHEGTCGCGAKKTEDHKWDNGKVTTEATCGKDGVKTFNCTVCKATKTEKVAATGKHDYTKSYKDNGDGTHTAKCDCGASKSEKHDYSVEGNVIQKPTTSAEGKQEKLCVCGAKTTITLAKLPADLDDVPKTGDITVVFAMGAAAMVTMAAAVAFVFKRKAR